MWREPGEQLPGQKSSIKQLKELCYIGLLVYITTYFILCFYIVN